MLSFARVLERFEERGIVGTSAIPSADPRALVSWASKDGGSDVRWPKCTVNGCSGGRPTGRPWSEHLSAWLLINYSLLIARREPLSLLCASFD